MKEWKSSKGVPTDPINGVAQVLKQDWMRPGVVHLGFSRAPGYMRSEDGGRSFKKIGRGVDQGIISIGICPTDRNRIYATLMNNDVIISKDYGISWRRTALRGVTKSKFFPVLEVDLSNAERIYFSRGNYMTNSNDILWRSDDSGESWTRMDRGVEGESLLPPDLIVTRKGRKIVVLDERIAQIKPGEDRWHYIDNNQNSLMPSYIVVDPHLPDTLWGASNGKIWRNDNGSGWKIVKNIDGVGNILLDAENPGFMMGGLYYRSGEILISKDFGKTWRMLTKFGAEDIVFSGGNLVGKTDSGVAWIKV